MKYIVKPIINGYSFCDVTFAFDDRMEALDFAEQMQYHSDEDMITDISIKLIREEAEA